MGRKLLTNSRHSNFQSVGIHPRNPSFATKTISKTATRCIRRSLHAHSSNFFSSKVGAWWVQTYLTEPRQTEISIDKNRTFDLKPIPPAIAKGLCLLDVWWPVFANESGLDAGDISSTLMCQTLVSMMTCVFCFEWCLLNPGMASPCIYMITPNICLTNKS